MYKMHGVVLIALILVAPACSKTKEELFAAGTRELQSQNPGVAVIHFKNALEKDENYAEARYQLALAYSTVGKYDSAEKELKKVLLQRAGAREVQVELARAYAFGGKADSALTITRQIPDSGNDAEVLEISGWAHALKKDYATAVLHLKKVLTIQPGRSSTLLMLSRVYLLMGTPKAAEEPVSALLKKDSSNIKALYLLAEIELRRKNTDSAMATYDRIIAQMPEESMAYFRKGLILLNTGRPDDSLELSAWLIKEFPSRREGFELQGLTYFHQKNYKEAITPLQKMLSFNANAGTYYLIGLCHFYIEELEQAMNQMQRALAAEPSMAQARMMVSLIYLKKNRLDEAISEINKVLLLEEKNAMAHSILGTAYLAKEMNSAGITELNRALDLDPGLTVARLKKGAFELSQGRTGAAETELSAVVKFNPDHVSGRLMLASYYLGKNENARAIEISQQGLRKQKSDAQFYNIIADAYLRQRKAEDALKALENAMAADPEYDATYFKYSIIHKLSGKPEKGFESLKKFAERTPQNVRAQLATASYLETNGHEKEARFFYERAAETQTSEGALAAARYYLRSRRPEKAVALLDESARKNPSMAALYELKAEACKEQKKYEDALQAYEELAKLDPETGMRAVVNTYLETNKPEKALERVRREMQKNPDRLDIQADISRIYLHMKKSSEAAENARSMIKQQPRSGAGYMALAMVHSEAKELDKAIDTLKKASASQVSDLNLTMMLGNFYAAGKDYSSALSEYQKAENLKAKYTPAVFQKASILQLMGKREQAIKEYQQVLKLQHDHVPALNNLAYLFAEDSNTRSSALQYAVQAYMLAPGNGAVQDTLGFVLLKNGKVSEGLKVLKQAASLVPDNPSVTFHLALALKENNDRSGAVSQLQKALALGDFPESDRAKALLVALSNGTEKAK